MDEMFLGCLLIVVLILLLPMMPVLGIIAGVYLIGKAKDWQGKMTGVVFFIIGLCYLISVGPSVFSP